jgi:tetratricopeptide (TPR) repeat protein
MFPNKMNSSHRALILMAYMAMSLGALLAQDAVRPLTRAEVLGRLAAGEPPSYVARLVKDRGTAFSVTADFLEMVRGAGGAGILLDRLSNTRDASSSSISRVTDPPFDHLARCAELEHAGANAQAEPECDAAIKADSQSPWPLLALSRSLMRQNKAEEAQAQSDRAAELSQEIMSAHLALNGLLSTLNDPDVAASHLRTAESLLRAKKKEEALAEVREAIRLEPDNPDNHAVLGRVYDDRIDAAKAEYQEVERLEPYDVGAHESFAAFLWAHGETAGALSETLEAVKVAPRDEGAHQSLIDWYKRTGDMQSQIDEYRRFLVLAPNAHEDRLDLAELLRQKPALEESAVECEELIRLIPADKDPDDNDELKQRWIGWAHNTLGNVRLAQERIDEAVSEYQLARQALPEEGVPVSNLANLLARHGRLQEAVDQFRAAQGLNSMDTYVYVGLGIALGRLGNLDSAKDEFDLALTIDPDNEGARTSLAHVFQLKGQLGQAIAEYQRVLASHPDSAVTHNNLADIYATSPDPRYRNPGAALEHAKRAVELSKTGSPHAQQANFLGTLAEALKLNGKSDEVLPTLRQAVAVDPANTTAHRNLASMLELSGDHAGAISEYEQELSLQPGSASAQNDLAWIYATCPDARYRNPIAALHHANRALELLTTDSSSPEKAAYLDTLAEALLVNLKYQEALSAEERAADADPSNLEIKKRIGRFEQAVRLSAIP